MILPTTRAAAVLAAGAVVTLLGFWTPVAVDAILTFDALVLALVILDGRFLAVPPRVLGVERHAPDAFSVGRPGEARYRWRNPTRRTARLRVREVLPEILGGPMPPRDLTVPARQERWESISLTPVARGRETGGWLALRSRGPLGLAHWQSRVPLPWRVTVYPTLPASRLKASIAEAARKREAGLRPTRRLGEGRQFESLREWVPGDDTRHIDWKATARRRKVIVRQYEEERRQQVLLVLDTGRLLTAEVGGEPRMEFVVRAALWLAFAANHHDDNVGLMVFADEIAHYVAPQRGRRGLRAVLDALATVRPRLVESDYPAAFRYLALRNRKRALTVFFTDVIDRLASEALVAHVGSLRPRHLPLVVTLRNPDLDAIADRRPAGVADAYRRAAAEELLSVRDEALAQMRARGALVLDVAPDHAAAAVVDTYQELKRKGRL